MRSGSVFFHISRYDWFLLAAVLILSVSGLVMLFSLVPVTPYPLFERQLMWFFLGLAVFFLASLTDYRLFRTQSFAVLFFYLLIIVVLFATLAGDYAVRGVESWIKLGVFSFQPVEAAKLAVIILLAKFFSRRHVEIYRARHLALSAVYAGVPTALVIAQPDFGSAVVLISIWAAIVIFSGIKLRHLFFLLVSAFLVSLITWQFVLAPYQKVRITSFLNPYADPKGAGYQMIQSMIAVGSGKIMGKGLGYGSQSHLNFLPEAETDFIFAAFAEEWGFVGITLILALFFAVILRIVKTGIAAADNFSRLFSFGLAAYIFFQTSLHIGMNTGILPITGLTLPFVSYGGSSFITLMAGLGILQNIRINSRRSIAEVSGA